MVRYIVSIENREYEIEVTDDGGQLAISVDGKRVDSQIEAGNTSRQFLMLLDTKSYDTEVFSTNGTTSVFVHGREFECQVEDQRLVAIRKAAGIKPESAKKELHAPMPGLVVRLLKSVGDAVKRGDSLLVVEAMKMENELKSPTDGKIREIRAVVGKPVDKGTVLITFE